MGGRRCCPGSSSAGGSSKGSQPGFCSLQVPKDLEVLLRATFFGTIFMLVRGARSQGGQVTGGPWVCGDTAVPWLTRCLPRTLLWWMRPCAWCFRCRPPPAA